MQKEEFEAIGALLEQNAELQKQGRYTEVKLLPAEYAASYINHVLYQEDTAEAGQKALNTLPPEHKMDLYHSIATEKGYASELYLKMLNEALDMDEVFQAQKEAFQAEMDAKQDAFNNKETTKVIYAKAKENWSSMDVAEKEAALQEIVTAYSEHLGYDKPTTVKLVEKQPNLGGQYLHDAEGGVYEANVNSPQFADFEKVANTTFHEMRHRVQVERMDAAINNKEADPNHLVTRMIIGNYNAYVSGSDNFKLYEKQFIEADARHAGKITEEFVGGLDTAKVLAGVSGNKTKDLPIFAFADEYKYSRSA